MSPSAKAAARRPARSDVRFCVCCEFDSAAGALYCDFCKEPFVKKPARAAPPAAAQAPRFRILAGAAVAAAALCWHAASPASPAIFDGSRDSAGDISIAVAQARSSGKLVLIEVGGDWCHWSVSLERLFAGDRALSALRSERFVTVKVYAPPVFVDLKGLGPDELRAARAATPKSLLPAEGLSRFPEITAYPYLMVLDCDGNLLKGKDLEEYERGDSYDAEGLSSFLDGASARPAHSPAS